MRAAWIDEPGGLDGLSVRDVDPPGPPGAGEVKVRIRAAALNFADLLMLDGTYQDTPPRPFIPGMELAGDVIAVGPDVDGVFQGDRIMAAPGRGAFAEEANIPAVCCTRMPSGLDYRSAAALPIGYGTAYVGLVHRGRLKAGDVLLVTGAAGGVGLPAVRLGKALGATVVGLASSDEKRARVRDAGADFVIDPNTEDLRGAIKSAVGGIDVAFDAVGGPLFDTLIRCARPEARLVIVGFAGGDIQKIPANLLLVKNIDVVGLYWGGYARLDPAIQRAADDVLRAMFEDGKLTPEIGGIFPLDSVAEAYRRMQARQAVGKIVIDIGLND